MEEAAVIRKLYSLSKRFACQVQPVLPVGDGPAPLLANATSTPPLDSSVPSSHSLLPCFHFLPTIIQDKWLPLAGNIEEIREFRRFGRRLMIMCSSRTGSEFLSYLLEDFSFDIQERFNVEAEIYQGRVPLGLPALRDYIISLLVNTKGGLFGVKGTAQASLPLFLYGEWPKYAHEWKIIRVQRRNVVRQAISLLIAEKSQSWHVGHVAKRAVQANEYDFKEILRCMEAIVLVNNHIERVVSLLGVNALTVFYEDLSADPRAVTDAVGRYLEIDRISTKALQGHGSTRPQPKVQSTDLNKRWEVRFREDLYAYDTLAELQAAAA